MHCRQKLIHTQYVFVWTTHVFESSWNRHWFTVEWQMDIWKSGQRVSILIPNTTVLQWGTVTVCSGLCGVAGSFITYWHRSRWPKYCNLVFQLFPILKFHDQRKECPCPDTVAEVPLCIHLISHGRSFMDIPFPVPHPSSLIYLTGHTVSWVQGISVYLQCLGYDLAVIWRHPLSQWIQMDLNYSILTHFE